MIFAEKYLKRREEEISDLHGEYHFKLNLGNRGLQSSFYYLLPHYYEPETQRYLRETIQPHMTVIDIGAHIGFHTLLLAKLVGPQGRVYSFEPEKNNFDRLKYHIEANYLHWVTPIKMAVSRETGVASLAIHTSDSGHSLKINEDHHHLQKIKTTTLDEFVKQKSIQKIDLIKIDVEKSEGDVLTGGNETFSRKNAPRVICEIHSSHKSSAVGQDKIRKMFYDYNYRSFWLQKKYLQELKVREPVIGLQNILFLKGTDYD